MNQRIAGEQEDLSMCSSLPKANGKKYLYAVINSKTGDDFLDPFKHTLHSH